MRRWKTMVFAGAFALGLSLSQAQAETITHYATYDQPTFQGQAGMAVIIVNRPIRAPAHDALPQEFGPITSWQPGQAAWSFIAPETNMVDGVDVVLGLEDGSAESEVVVALHGDQDGLPGAMLRSASADVLTHCYQEDHPMPVTRGVFEAPAHVVQGHRYWVVVSAPADSGPHWHFNTLAAPGNPGVGAHSNGCTGRVGAAARMLPGWETWVPYPEVEQYPGCSLAFRVWSRGS